MAFASDIGISEEVKWRAPTSKNGWRPYGLFSGGTDAESKYWFYVRPSAGPLSRKDLTIPS